MNTVYVWLFVVLGVAGVALIWRKKRRYERTNEHGIQRHGSYWKKVKADSFDAMLLWVGYLGLTASAIILVMIDPTLLIWLLIVAAVAYWLRMR